LALFALGVVLALIGYVAIVRLNDLRIFPSSLLSHRTF
jgi:hypothetical protein